MRRIFLALIICFLLFSTVMIVFFDHNQLDYISILTINQERQRLITENEGLSITVYLSSNDSFLIDESLVTGTYIKNETNELQVSLTKIQDLNYEEEFQYTTYYSYCIDINFEQVALENSTMNFEDAFLVINYLNGESIHLEIGNLYLKFEDIDNPPYINMTRMFATYYPDTNIVSGLVIALDNLTGFHTVVENISINNPNINLDMSNLALLETAPSYNTAVSTILGEPYEGIGEVNDFEGLILVDEQLIYIPFKYESDYVELDRFPIMIDFTYQNIEYQYMIDDFMFNSQNLGLEVNHGHIREFIYHY